MGDIKTTEEALLVADRLASAIQAGAAERDRLRRAPIEELDEISASGLLGIAVPARYGGPELPCRTHVEVFRRLARADSAVAQLLLAHFTLQQRLRTTEQTELAARIYADVMQGCRIGNAVAERGTATAFEWKTTIRRDESGDLRLSGRKYYATGALSADLLAVTAMTPAGNRATVFVRAQDTGIQMYLEEWSSFGQRTTFSGGVGFENVKVDPSLVLDDGESQPEQLPPSIFPAYDQILHAAVDIGIARAALEDGIEFIRSKTRPWFDAGVDKAREEPHIKRRVGELSVRLDALEALLARGATVIDDALDAPSLDDENTAAASLAVAGTKALAQEFALEIASGIFELAGASATDEEIGLDRHWRNVRVHSLHDPARWKYVYIGDYRLNGTLPPRGQVI